MKQYARLLAVSGGLVAATAACSGQEAYSEDEAAYEVDAAEGSADWAVDCYSVACEAAACCAATCCAATCCAATCCAASGGDVEAGPPAPPPAVAAYTYQPSAPTAQVDAQTPPDPQTQRPPLDIPSYPDWPPREASSRIDIGDLIRNREDLSLFDAGQRLRAALDLADYPEHSFYSVPGGFILVTQREQIDPQGRALQGLARFQRPGEGRDTSMMTRIRDLFLERPPSYYRYVAIVITDRPFGATEGSLSAQEATDIVQLGSTALTRDARDIAFTDDFIAIALIYEYVNNGVGSGLDMIEPGRLRPREHLERSGLADALPRVFRPAGGN